MLSTRWLAGEFFPIRFQSLTVPSSEPERMIVSVGWKQGWKYFKKILMQNLDFFKTYFHHPAHEKKSP